MRRQSYPMLVVPSARDGNHDGVVCEQSDFLITEGRKTDITMDKLPEESN